MLFKNAVILEDEIYKKLYDAGYRIGYQCVGKDIMMNATKVNIWCNPIAAIRVDIENGRLSTIYWGDNTIYTSSYTYNETMEAIEYMLKHIVPATAMNIFKNAIFREYDNNASKAKAFLGAYEEFSDQLMRLYFSEAEALRAHCAPAVTFNELDIVKDENGEYGYISAVIGHEYVIHDLIKGMTGSEVRVKDIRELTSEKYKKIDKSDKIYNNMYDLLIVLMYEFKDYITPEFVKEKYGVVIPNLDLTYDKHINTEMYIEDTAVARKIHIVCRDLCATVFTDGVSENIWVRKVNQIYNSLPNIYNKSLVGILQAKGLDMEDAMGNILIHIIDIFRPIIGKDSDYTKLAYIANMYNDLPTVKSKPYKAEADNTENGTKQVTRQEIESNWIQKMLSRNGDNA